MMMLMMNHRASCFLLLLMVVPSSCFLSIPQQQQQPSKAGPLFAKDEKSSSSPEALTEYMAKAHVEKIRAMADVEATWKVKVQELEAKIATLEGNQPVRSGPNSFDMPATNKEMTAKVNEYRTFIQSYILKSHQHRVEAVAEAEKKTKEKYEAIIAELKKGGDKATP